jgi:GntR family transcriptional regulator
MAGNDPMTRPIPGLQQDDARPIAAPPSGGVKYLDLRNHVLAIVESLPMRTPIPSERELSTTFNVSRMTVRRALDELERDGFLLRRQGAPTLTAKPKIAQRMTILSFTEDMRRRGLASSSRLISSSVQPAGARLGGRLHVAPAEPVMRVGRLRLADAEPMALEWLHVPRSLVPGLDAGELENESFYGILANRFGIKIAGGSQTVEPTVVDEPEARLLDVPVHSPALFVERTTWTASGQLIEFVQSTYRGDRYRFEVELMPAPAPARS